MATQLALAHKKLQNHLQLVVAAAVAEIWRLLGSYNEPDVPRFLDQALPLVAAGQAQSASLAAAFIARSMRVPAFGIDPARVTGAAVRAGTPPETVYHPSRSSRRGTTSARASPTTRPSASASRGPRPPRTWTWRWRSARASRSPRTTCRASTGTSASPSAGACDFCQSVAGAYCRSANSMPLHNHCSCTLEPLTSAHPSAKWLPDGTHVADSFAVHEHGELGAVLTNPDDQFTTEAEIGA